MHRNTDGTRLIRNRSRDGLPDPPRGIGRELVTAAILELVDRLHQANVAFLNQIEKLKPPVGVLLGDRNHETQVSLYHFFFGAPGTGFAHAHTAIDLLDFGDAEARGLFDIRDLPLQALQLFFVLIDLGADVFLARYTANPAAVTFGALEALNEFFAVHSAVAHHNAHDLAFRFTDCSQCNARLVNERIKHLRRELKELK